jgi:hypothetical protein
MRLPPPDFVVVGAPKCGTTAVYATLRQHSQVFLPELKEPHFFAYDFPGHREVTTMDGYDRLFAEAGSTQLRGEASVLYLRSKEATPAIFRRRPDAKFIAMVRNPLDMFISMHNQNLNHLYEEELNPERAWMLQEERAQGRRIPKLCREPAFLQYKTLCSLGTQIDSFFRLAPERQRLVIVFDDFEQHPRQAYKQIVEFLGIRDDGKDRFARENVFGRPKSAFITEVIRFANQNPGANRLGIRLKPTLHKHGIRPLTWLSRRNMEYIAKPALSMEFRRELEAAFAPDVQLLERLLRRDLCELWSIRPGAAYVAAGTGMRNNRAAAPGE